MEIITNTTDFFLDRDTAVAIGKFDGVHAGHRKLLEMILAKKSQGLASCVFTFDPAPAVLFGYSDGKELTTREEKRMLLERMGVDILIEFPMTKETAAIAPKEFVTDLLCERMRARYIAAGTDLSFGDKGAGNAALLESMGESLGFETETIEKIKIEGLEASSTLARECVEAGDMLSAEKLLEMPYAVYGEVVHGNHLGTSLGFPTVNIIPAPTKLLPPCGVYYSCVSVDGQMYRAISNVGYKPTVASGKICGVETYLYDFDRDIYGKEICVYLLEFKRPEQKFAGVEALKEQLKEDIAAGSTRKSATNVKFML